MFRNIFGNLNVKIPDEPPGTRWRRLRKLAMLTKKDTGIDLEQIGRLEAASDMNQSRVSMQTALRYAVLLGKRLKCPPVEILTYVYPELNQQEE